jgi:hypothetical protein
VKLKINFNLAESVDQKMLQNILNFKFVGAPTNLMSCKVKEKGKL